MNKLKIKSNDTVLVIAGNAADKGKKGKVLSVNPETGRIVVQNVALVTRHQKPRRQGEEGGRIKKERSIDVSNVMLVCPNCKKPTRVGYVVEGDKKYRVCKNAGCGKKID